MIISGGRHFGFLSWKINELTSKLRNKVSMQRFFGKNYDCVFGEGVAAPIACIFTNVMPFLALFNASSVFCMKAPSRIGCSKFWPVDQQNFFGVSEKLPFIIVH